MYKNVIYKKIIILRSAYILDFACMNIFDLIINPFKYKYVLYIHFKKNWWMQNAIHE
jgi:hypothetical protein